MKTSRILIVFIIISVVLVTVGSIYIINEWHDIRIRFYKIEMTMFFIERESCEIQCNENNLSYSSIDFDRNLCFCSNEDYEITTFRIKINSEVEERYFKNLILENETT